MVKCEYCGKEIDVREAVKYNVGGRSIYSRKEHLG